MGNCQRCMDYRGNAADSRMKIVLLLVGLDNAGKTSTAKGLVGEMGDAAVPTVGFSSVTLVYGKYSVIIYDLGGGPQIRGIWHRYFVDVHGIIFVVDASDVRRLEECRNVLNELLTHPKLSGKPLLLLANKQDCEGALDELDIVERLDLEKLVNEQRCPTMVETCSATAMKNSKKKLDPAIHNGYKWLLNCIVRDFPSINARVIADMAEQKDLLEQSRRARLLKYLKEQNEDENSAQENNEEMQGNPFRPIAEVLDQKKKKMENGSSVHISETDENKVSDVTKSVKENANVPDEEIPCQVTKLIKEQLELEKAQFKKLGLFRRTNKTGPAPLTIIGSSSPTENTSTVKNDDKQSSRQDSGISSPPKQLPPLQLSGKSVNGNGMPWFHSPIDSTSCTCNQEGAWDLHKAFDVVPSSEDMEKDEDSEGIT